MQTDGNATIQKAPSPDHVRIIVDVERGDHRMVADFPVEHLPHWLAGMQGLTPVPLPRWTEAGAVHAREIFRLAVASDYPLMAILCATWIALYGPGGAVGRLTLEDLHEVAGVGTLVINVRAGGTRWEYAIESGIGHTLDDFETAGNA